MLTMYRLDDVQYVDLELEGIKRVRPAGGASSGWMIVTIAGDIRVKDYPVELIEVMASTIRHLQGAIE